MPNAFTVIFDALPARTAEAMLIVRVFEGVVRTRNDFPLTVSTTRVTPGRVTEMLTRLPRAGARNVCDTAPACFTFSVTGGHTGG